MSIGFQQNRDNRSVITVHTNVYAKNRKLHQFAATNQLKKSILSEIHHRKTYMYINFFIKIGLVDQLKPCTQIYLQKLASCVDMQLPIVILKNKLF